MCVLNLKNIASFRTIITPAVKYMLMGLVLVLTASFHPAKHPFYMGLTEISFNEKPEIQVSVRLFTNDLEDALRKSSGKSIDILNPKDKAEADSILFHYLNKRLTISINAKPMKLSFIGYEKEEESIWTYMEIKSAKPLIPKMLKIHNNILYDYFPGQTHIIRVNRNGIGSSKKINNPESQAEFIF